MKKLLQIVFLSLAVTLSVVEGYAQTNVYHPFPDSAAMWNMDFSSPGLCQGVARDYYSVIISADTVIGSKTYHKLNVQAVQIISTSPVCANTAVGYKGAIRQDTASRKVFFVLPFNNTEKLLYDFTMQVGDTVIGIYGSIDTIQSIDSILVGNTYRKRWNIINPCLSIAIHIIEGIGSTYGLIELTPGCLTDMPDFTLTCFNQNGLTLYPSTATNCQLITTSVNSINKISNQVNVFPNPTNGKFTISSFENFSSIEISDVLGNVIKKSNASTPPSTPLGMTFDLSSDPKGIYFVKVMDEKGNFGVKKIIIP